MEKKIVLLISLFFFISLVSASSIYFDFEFSVVEQNTCFNIPGSCDNCTYMNITILFPNGTVIVENQAMTNLSSTYYYNYTFCNTSTLGSYIYITHYDEDSYLETDENFFEVTPSGRSCPCSASGIIFLSSVATMFLISLLFFFISNSFKGDSAAMSGSKEAEGNPAARFVFIALSFIVGVIAVLYSSVSLMEIFWGFDRIISSYSAFLYIILAVLFLLFIFILINLIIRAIEAMRNKRGLRE